MENKFKVDSDVMLTIVLLLADKLSKHEAGKAVAAGWLYHQQVDPKYQTSYRKNQLLSRMSSFASDFELPLMSDDETLAEWIVKTIIGIDIVKARVAVVQCLIYVEPDGEVYALGGTKIGEMGVDREPLDYRHPFSDERREQIAQEACELHKGYWTIRMCRELVASGKMQRVKDMLIWDAGDEDHIVANMPHELPYGDTNKMFVERTKDFDWVKDALEDIALTFALSETDDSFRWLIEWPDDEFAPDREDWLEVLGLEWCLHSEKEAFRPYGNAVVIEVSLNKSYWQDGRFAL